MLNFLLRAIAYMLIPICVIVFFNASPGLGFSWDFANLMGFFSLVLCGSLFFLTGRPLKRPRFDGKFFMTIHEFLGYALIATATVHITFTIYAEPLVLQELLPSGSWYMLSGLAATILMLLLAILSSPKARKKLFKNHKKFKNIHYIASCLALTLSGLHVFGASYYANSRFKIVFITFLVVFAIALPRLNRKDPLTIPRRKKTAHLGRRLSLIIAITGLAISSLYAALANIDLPK